jgi:hypothetical protein
VEKENRLYLHHPHPSQTPTSVNFFGLVCFSKTSPLALSVKYPNPMSSLNELVSLCAPFPYANLTCLGSLLTSGDTLDKPSPSPHGYLTFLASQQCDLAPIEPSRKLFEASILNRPVAPRQISLPDHKNAGIMVDRRLGHTHTHGRLIGRNRALLVPGTRKIQQESPRGTPTTEAR